MNTRRLNYVGAAVCCFVAAGHNAHAQGGNTLLGPGVEGKRPVVVAQSAQVAIVHSAESLGPSHVKVVRRVQVVPRDIVLVDSAASSRDLAAGLLLFVMLRSQSGDSLKEPMSAVPANGLLPPTFTGRSFDVWAVGQLKRLRGSRATRNVPGYGESKVIMVRVPAARVRIAGDKR